MKKIILSVAAGIVLLSCSSPKKTASSNARQPLPPSDSTKKVVKAYRDIITDKAITDDGLIKVHKMDSRYYFEIADSILNKDILIVNRISKAAAQMERPQNGFLGYAGDYIGENVIRLETGPDHKLFIKRVSYLDLSRDSSENGMFRSVCNSTFLPIVASFDIKAYTPDSTSCVIDITDYIKGDNDLFFFNPMMKKDYGLGALQADKSYTESIKSFPLNTEIQTVKTYSQGEAVLTYELNSSIVLLPADPMKPRYYDQRVGYFARGFRDFDFPQAAKPSYVITRWRMEPKDADIEKYNRGELVEPKKPIVYYIDPATPKKWIPYLIQGVNAWQKAFEKAGFKNAIYALEAPTNDSTWSLEDARHNVIVYKASFLQNASGPQISDPRSGEVLESHINWYHNVQQLLHDWYFIQASPNDPRARKMEFDDTLMGELIRYVCTHEVGHTLGLQHNFIASASIPVDSLRSRHYVSKNGHSASIMDYARFNYVAQPEDSINVKDLIPGINVYDDWAIEWGYKWLPQLETRDQEKAWMNKWIIERLEKDKRLYYAGYRAGVTDFRNQMEDLGDNAIKASFYGIKNLKIVSAHLKEWTRTPNNNYADLIRMHVGVINQYTRYINFVSDYIAATTVLPKTVEQDGPVLVFADRKTQKEAVQFLHNELFDNTEWIDASAKELFPLIGGGNISQMYKIQEFLMEYLINAGVYNVFLLNETNQPKNSAYSFDEYLQDMENGIFKELKNHKNIDIYRRTIQKVYVTKLAAFLKKKRAGDFGMLDGCTIAYNHIKELYSRLSVAVKGYQDQASKGHLEYLIDQLKATIDDHRKDAGESPTIINFGSRKSAINNGLQLYIDLSAPPYYENNRKSCWEEVAY